MIIFIAGGVTYSEMRLAYTLGQSLGKDIYIGWSFLTRQDLVLMFRIDPYPNTGEVLQRYEITWSRWNRGESTHCPP